jgi:hypothetical protein
VNSFFESINRLAQPDYLPTDEDILRARTKTTGLYEAYFTINETLYHFVDVGGVRSERRKWIHAFESVTTIIFTIDIAAYDEVLLECPEQNSMYEALVLWDSVCNSRWFMNTQFVLFFNKMDKLNRKLARSPLKKYFPDYKGDPTNLEQVKKYFRDRFLGVMRKPKPGEVTVRFTSILDSTSLSALAIASIDPKNRVHVLL